MPESTAHELFKEYTAPGAAALLQGLPSTSPRTFETTWREFKSGYVKDADFNRIWSEIIGAFANTEGGVVVWGIYANTVPGSKVDAAESINLVANVNEFTTRLKKAAKDAVSPPIPIDVVPVPLGDGTEQGFVICHVPEGDDKPYESLQASSPYWGRFDDRCEKLGRSFLRQLFHPKVSHRMSIHICAQRKLPLIFRIEGEELSISHEGKCIEVGVKNDGEHTIHDLAIAIKCAPGAALVEWKHDRFKEHVGDAWFIDGSVLLGSLHPGSQKRVQVIRADPTPKDEAVWNFVLYAKDMLPKRASVAHKLLPIQTGEPLIVQCE